MTLRIGNGAGFLGDNLDAPRLLAEAGGLDYLTLEYLAELTMSVLARSREKDPAAGYAQDFITVLGSLRLALVNQPKLRVVTNGGGVNPQACAQAAARVLVQAGLGQAAIGVVTGDDITSRLAELHAAGCRFENLDTGAPLDPWQQDVVRANAYLGAEGIARALGGGARVVITGRVADASLTVGPAVHEFRWPWEHLDRLAGASVAGHLIECGAQVTGGYLTTWERFPVTECPDYRGLDLANVGYPIAELEPTGECVITKPEGTGGAVNRQTVAAQLVYEIGDPRHYLTPDVDVDFTTVELEEIGNDRVAVRGATGGLAPEHYKVSLAYRAGYMTSGELLVYGRDALTKARASAEMILARLRRAGCEPEQVSVECLGAGEGVPGLAAKADVQANWTPPEVVLRIAACDPRRETLERFAREFAPLATSGPAGLAGYTAARGQVRPVFAYWPTLVPKELVQPRVEVRLAQEW